MSDNSFISKKSDVPPIIPGKQQILVHDKPTFSESASGTMAATTILVLGICLFSLLCTSCRKDHETPLQLPQDNLLKVNNVVFNTKSSNNLKDHFLNIDTLNYSPYTLHGFGAFTGKSRYVDFRGGGFFHGIPVIGFSGWDDYGYTYIAKDTAGRIMEVCRQQFGSSGFLFPWPSTVFASKNLLLGDEWDSFSGWEQDRHTTDYRSFKTKILSTNSTTSHGIGGCIELEYRAPDYVDTVLFKPGKGPVEIRSWRSRTHGNNQQGNGGYR